MQFNSLVFIAFLGVVLLLHNLPLPWRARKFNLLWLSYVFYCAWNPPFVLLLWISTLTDWFVAKKLHRTEEKTRRRLLLILSLTVNLGMLSYFKYGTFVAENFAAAVAAVGFDWHPASPSIVLPVGISFYTFQTLSYTLDVHARRIKPCSSFLDYALFVTFFPQLVAGPIVRARSFLPQCRSAPKVSAEQFGWGAYLLVIGLFEKIVVADGVLAPTVDAVFQSQGSPTNLDYWIACAGGACQVFCDFAGYSTCAIGVALCLGFRLPMNFNFPLAAVGPTDFWKRWHLSLTSWVRDYVFFPLIGKRATYMRWILVTILTMMLMGLWHRATWNFVLFGAFCGVLLACERVLRDLTPKSAIWMASPVQFSFAALHFAFMSIAFVAWFVPSFHELRSILGTMFSATESGHMGVLSSATALSTAAMTATVFLLHWFMRHSSLEALSSRTPWALRTAALAFMLAAIILSPAQDRAFIYFQF